uniref:Uncharacterized protein n=1 Tax=Rousettus aegyptiacus TaxID=9407 RepID=A0A7J8JGY5_ROUAE|nr:hypothetical protein HJG63_010384 [Rousettus aegyptiacus]
MLSSIFRVYYQRGCWSVVIFSAESLSLGRGSPHRVGWERLPSPFSERVCERPDCFFLKRLMEISSETTGPGVFLRGGKASVCFSGLSSHLFLVWRASAVCVCLSRTLSLLAKLANPFAKVLHDNPLWGLVHCVSVVICVFSSFSFFVSDYSN